MSPFFRAGAKATVPLILAPVVLAACHAAPPKTAGPQVAAPTVDKVELLPSQLGAIAIDTIGRQSFSPRRTAVGAIDFNQDRAVPVYPSYQGKIVEVFVRLGDAVEKGQALYTLESPDLMTASSTLITTQATYEANRKALDRARRLAQTQGISTQTVEQAEAAEIASEGALRAARAALRVYGKSDDEIAKMAARHEIDPLLVVKSPITGRVTARVAQPGLLAQPGTAPAPLTVADLSTMWMNANVAEVDSPLFRKGQAVSVKVAAFPDKAFRGVISVLGATIDPATHTQIVRVEVADPNHELRPGMMATYVIETGAAQESLAVPAAGVVREGDGSFYVWVTQDERRFERRKVSVGLLQAGYDQILEGVKPGERVVTKGAVFLSNMANAASAGDD
jgi:cobalt-zinc-cadmium efflux system membrane fusion protein